MVQVLPKITLTINSAGVGHFLLIKVWFFIGVLLIMYLGDTLLICFLLLSIAFVNYLIAICQIHMSVITAIFLLDNLHRVCNFFEYSVKF